MVVPSYKFIDVGGAYHLSLDPYDQFSNVHDERDTFVVEGVSVTAELNL
jgi:hypothetical protein